MRLKTGTLIVGLLLTLSGVCYAQEDRASISGSITDPAGALVAGATITVTNVEKNTATVVESTTAGTYLVPNLVPGTYTLTVGRTGFKRFLRQNIVLQTLDKARVDVQLELGAVSESVTVTSTVSTLQTETAMGGQTLDNQILENAPTQGRNPIQLVWNAPGISFTGTFRFLRAFDTGGTSGFTVNGGRGGENEILLDGISDMQASRSIINMPTIESVQEFKLLTNIYDAQYDRTGGGVVTIVTKSGTNQFHGNAWENLENTHLNANQAELNAVGQPKSPYHINNYGIQAGGPVVIPKVFNGRNKLFWLFSYEGNKQRSADPNVVTFPTMAVRTGDFSGLFNAQGQRVLIYDPLTTTTSGVRQPFANNVIPPARINAIAKNAFAYYPPPNAPGVGPAQVNNYVFPSRWVGDLDNWAGRMDYQINEKNSVSFRYGEDPYSEYRGLIFVLDINQKNPAEPTGNAPLLRNGRTLTFNWNSTLSPHLTFNLRAGLNRWENGGGDSFGAGFNPAQLGFSAALVSQFPVLQFPQFSFSGYQSMGGSVINFGMDDTYSLQPNVNYVVGKHFMHFGFEGRKYNDNTIGHGNADGNYSFTAGWTQAAAASSSSTAGNSIASFLLGYPASATADRVYINPAYAHFYYGLFFQDDWKITRRLTLNLGLRWDYESPATERYNRMVLGLNQTAASPIASQVQGMTLNGAVQFAGINGNPRGIFAPDRNNFAPRIGAAYHLADKWVLRGGYGLYYLGQSAFGSTLGFTNTTSAVISTDGLTPAVDLTNAFALLPNGQLLSPIGTSQGAGSFLGQSISAQYYNRPLPYSQQYSFNIQHELPGNILVEGGYAGNLTRGLPISGNLNRIPLNQLNQLNPNGTVNTAYYTKQVTNPMAGLIPVNASLNGATIQQQILWYAFPQFTQVAMNNIPIGKQRYDGFQSKVTRRFSKGLTVFASYSVSKTLQQIRLQNPQDLNLSNIHSIPLVKEPADALDMPRKFAITGVYELPVGRGRHFASGLPKALDCFIGGWNMSWNITYLSGEEVAYPNAPQGSPGTAKLSDPTMLRWFNTSLWLNPSTGSFVSPPNLTYTTRTWPYEFSDVRLPPFHNWDASVSKYFAIHEQMRLQFRVDGVNAFNHPWFSNGITTDVTSGAFGQLSPTERNLPRFVRLGLYLQW